MGPGRHSVEQTYRPPGMALGLALGALSLAVLLALSMASRGRAWAEAS